MKGTNLVIIKSGDVEQKLVDEAIQRFEDKGIDLLHLKFGQLTVEAMREHYEYLKDELFFPELLAYIANDPVAVTVAVRDNVVRKAHKLVGATSLLDTESGTLRVDYRLSVARNLIHASGSVQPAKVKMQQFFD